MRILFCILIGLLLEPTGFAGSNKTTRDSGSSGLKLATFDVDATPPVGSPTGTNANQDDGKPESPGSKRRIRSRKFNNKRYVKNTISATVQGGEKN